MKKEIKVLKEEAGQRLDRFLSLKFPEFSRSFLVRLIDGGEVLVGGKKVRPSFVLRGEELVEANLREPEKNQELKPTAGEIDVICEDSEMLVINKPAGLVVHPAAGHQEDTLVNILAHERPDLKRMGDLRPGIVHRLDKDTSGVMVVAKTPQAFKSLSDQISGREIKKNYKAIVFGRPQTGEGKIEAPIGRSLADRKKMSTSGMGRKAVTGYVVDQSFPGFSVIDAFPVTGRTHQIRVHLSFIGHPILGDKLYSSRSQQREAEALGVVRQMLHAFRLGLKNPKTGEWQEFEAPLPRDFLETIERISKKAL